MKHGYLAINISQEHGTAKLGVLGRFLEKDPCNGLQSWKFLKLELVLPHLVEMALISLLKKKNSEVSKARAHFIKINTHNNLSRRSFVTT